MYQYLSATIFCLIICFVILALYRLLFHSLAGIPGPVLAAITGWYETYFDCILGGKFSAHIDQLRKQHGICTHPLR